MRGFIVKRVWKGVRFPVHHLVLFEIVKFLVEIFLSDSCLNSSRCRL
jgi:hypothetical protein